jgi:HSP20 family protein
MQNAPTHSDWWPDLIDPLKRFGHRVTQYLSPPADASSNEDAYSIEMEVPGVKENDISVEIRGDQLTLSGEKRSERNEQTETYLISERSFGAFQRNFRLPADVDTAKIEAHVEDGVLRVTLPRKAGSDAAKRRIEVRRAKPRGITGDPRPNFE